MFFSPMSPPEATCTEDARLVSITRNERSCCDRSSATDRVIVFCSNISFRFRCSPLLLSTCAE